MAWLILFIAGLLETGWVVGLKFTEGLSKNILLSLITIGAMALSMVLLGYAMRFLPMGTAYAVWTGIGSVGAVILGIILFGEVASISRIFCIALIVGGIMGLKFLGKV